MAPFNFYDHFANKMRSLRPSSRTAGEDWQRLSQRLDSLMPTAFSNRRWRLAAAALLLLLLGSNLWWGFTFRVQNEALGRLEAQAAQQKTEPLKREKTTPCEEAIALRKQVADLQDRLGEAKAALAIATFHQPSLVQNPPGIFSKKEMGTGSLAPDFSTKNIAPGQAAFPENGQQAAGNAAPGFSTKNASAGEIAGDISPLAFSENERPAAPLALPEKLPAFEILPLKMSHRPLALLPDNDLVMLPAADLPFTKKAAQALLPKSFSIGATAGWLYPLEPDMEHLTGYGYGFQAAVGFSRKVSLTADWHRASLHYNALAPDAAIGLSTLPLPSPEHSFLQMEVSNQRLTFLGLGLRYKSLPQANWHPYGSIGWSGMKVSMFMAHYETDVAGSIHKGMYHVTQRSGLKHYARLGAGVELPLGKRADLTLEGYYLHAWRNGEPEMMGVRTGLNFNF